jgi:ABC-2 type transport system permease protein
MKIKDMKIALFTIVSKEFARIIRIWPQTLIPPVTTMLLYFVIFGEIIGKNLELIDGVSYITYIIPGLVMNAVIINSFGNTVSSFFSAKMHHNIEEMLVSPMPNWLIVMGYVIGGMIRGLIVGALVTIVACFFVKINPAHWLFTLIVMILSSMLFATLGIINALFAKTYDDISWIPTFVLTPLVYLGGVFYPISILPEFWQNISLFNPILYIVNAFRYGILEISSVNPYIALSSIFIFNIIIFISTCKMMNMGIGIKK